MDRSKWFALIQYVLPVVLSAAAPGFAPLAPVIVHAIGASEAMHGATGAQKLQNALGLVGDAVDIANGVAVAKGHPPVMDKTAVMNTAAGVISTTVDVANIVHQFGTAVQLPPAPPADNPPTGDGSLGNAPATSNQ